MSIITPPEEPMPDTPNPGSDAAIEQGCECPIMDNGRGRGYMGQQDVFAITESCPLHGIHGKEDE